MMAELTIPEFVIAVLIGATGIGRKFPLVQVAL